MTDPANPLGVSSHLFRGPPEAVASACRQHGLTCVQLTPNFPGLSFHEPGQVTVDRCRRAAAPFAEAGIPVACLWASTNLLDPDLTRRHRGLLRLHALISHARDFGTRFVVTETGSLNPHSPWEPYPPNRSAAAWTELRLILTEALRVAADHGVTLLLKVGRTHVMGTADDARRLGEELDHPCLGFVLDPAAYLMDARPEELAEGIERLVEMLGPRSPVVHAKDIRYEEQGVSLPRVGAGVLDYGLLLRQLARYQPEAPVILEHLSPNEVPAAIAYMKEVLGSRSRHGA